MSPSEEAPAVPLWINGHAYLTVPPAFRDVRAAASGALLRRTPLCGAAAAVPALAAAEAALPGWQRSSLGERAALIAALGLALAAYAEHFARLIAEESGSDPANAAAEVERTLALLATPAAAPTARFGVVAVIAGFAEPLYAPLVLAIPALLGGATLILRPAPAAPSALLAFAELSARCAFPAGVVNVVHGDEAMVAALAERCAQTLYVAAAGPSRADAF
jgi:acyl-CoA reductase-like NAD-dependent aldehyde dehydrogenase